LVFVLFRKTPRRGGKMLKDFDENWEVFVWKEREGIVEVGMGSALGSTTIVAMLMLCMAGLSPGAELFIDRAKDVVNYKAGKGWREGISLGETILLDEKIEGTIGLVEKTFVWALIHEIKVVHESMEMRVGFKDIEGFLLRHLIPTIDQVNKNACSVWG
jgi:hypothetical protein